MNHDAKRATGRGAAGERHAIGVTRMCLRSGSVQLPFALSGRLPEGELLVKDVESDEAVVLWSDPPRRLTGLGALFERHEVQVNDQLILDLQGDDLRLSVAKRPRRSRPKVTPSTWTSHRDPPRPAADDAEAPTTGATDSDAPDGGPRGSLEREARPRHPLGHADARSAPELDDVADDRFGAADDGGRARSPDARRGRSDGAAYDDLLDDDAPRAPRVKVKPLPQAQDDASDPGHGSGPAGRPNDADRPQEGGGPFAGLWRTARGWFTGAPSPRTKAGAADEADEPDWTSAWDADDEVEDAPAAVEAFAPDASPPRTQQRSTPRRAEPRFGVRGDDVRGHDVRGDDVRGDDIRGDDARSDDVRRADVRIDEVRTDEIQADEAQTDEAPVGEVRSPDLRVGDVRDEDVRIEDLPPAGERPRPARTGSRRSDRTSERVADDEPIPDGAAPASDVASESAEPVPAPPAGATPDAFGRRVIGEGFLDDEDDVDDVHDTWSTDSSIPPRPEPWRDIGTAAESDRRSDPDPAEPRPSAAPGTDEHGETADAEPSQAGPVETWTAPAADAGTPTEAASPSRGGDHGDHAPVDSDDETTGPTLPSGVPIRAERFLGGDLRTRLLRFLSSPDMPLIAKADMIAKRFDLDPDTAREMLEDVADDPPDGLRLTPVREGAWRIERTGT